MLGPRPLVSVVAYADNVTIFLTSVTSFQVVEDVIRLFEEASGARVNLNKSEELPIGRWKTFDTILGIEYCPIVKILEYNSGAPYNGPSPPRGHTSLDKYVH
jgi:hypothetical protein